MARAAAAVWAALLAAWSLMPRPPGSHVLVRFSGGSLLAHVFVYGVLCLLLLAGAAGRRRVLVAAGATLLYGLLIESLQPLTGRSFEWGDLIANVAGVLLAGAWLAYCASRSRPQR